MGLEISWAYLGVQDLWTASVYGIYQRNMMTYSSMTKSELELNLKLLKSRFEDLEETITFNLAYSSAHIGAGQVRKDEASLNELKAEICRIQTILSADEHGKL